MKRDEKSWDSSLGRGKPRDVIKVVKVLKV